MYKTLSMLSLNKSLFTLPPHPQLHLNIPKNLGIAFITSIFQWLFHIKHVYGLISVNCKCGLSDLLCQKAIVIFFSSKSDRNIYYSDVFSQRTPSTLEVFFQSNPLNNTTNSNLWTERM